MFKFKKPNLNENRIKQKQRESQIISESTLYIKNKIQQTLDIACNSEISCNFLYNQIFQGISNENVKTIIINTFDNIVEELKNSEIKATYEIIKTNDSYTNIILNMII